MNEIIVASNNTHKTDEIRTYFALLGQEAVNYRQVHPAIHFPAETQNDMRTNAQVKAETIHRLLPTRTVLADDSALFIDSLPDHFGVTTMREFQAHQLKTDEAINDYVLSLLTKEKSRRAYIQSDFYLIKPNGQVIQTKGRGGVAISDLARGNQGLYNILLAENGQTIGEMTASQRLVYAPRGRAVQKLLQILTEQGKQAIN